MADVSALEVRITQGSAHPGLKRFLGTLRDLSGALDDVDRALIPTSGAHRPRWQVSDLAHSDDMFRVRLTAAPSRVRDRESLLRSVVVLVDGARALHEEPEVPKYYSGETVGRLLKIARATDGVEQVALATVNGQLGGEVALTGALVTHGLAATRESGQSIGSITGTLDVISTRAKAGVRVSVFDPVRRRSVSGTVDEGSVELVRASWGRRVSVRGRITRNARGQAIRMQISSLEVLPSDDSGRPDVAEVLGAAPSWTGGLTVDEFVAQARRRRG